MPALKGNRIRAVSRPRNSLEGWLGLGFGTRLLPQILATRRVRSSAIKHDRAQILRDPYFDFVTFGFELVEHRLHVVFALAVHDDLVFFDVIAFVDVV